MRLFNIIILLFLLGAFTIGVSYANGGISPDKVFKILADSNVTDIELDRLENSDGAININRILTILESYVRFILVATIQILQMGIEFGFDNPDYFEATFVFKIINLIVVLVIISLLIKPVTYLVVLIALIVMWFNDKIKTRKEKKDGNKINQLPDLR